MKKLTLVSSILSSVLVLGLSSNAFSFESRNAGVIKDPTPSPVEVVIRYTNEQWCLKNGGEVRVIDDTYGDAPYRGNVLCYLEATNHV